jgi:hypothetical protein
MWQYILIGCLIALALVYLARQLWRSAKGCGGGCHCAGKKEDGDAPVRQVTMIPEDELKIRRQR